MNKWIYAICIIGMSTLSSCADINRWIGDFFSIPNNKDISKIEYFPIKEGKSVAWSMVNTNGDFLVKEEFEGKPTPIVNDYFFVSFNNGYEIYSVKQPTKPIGDTYKSIAYFSSEYTPSVKLGEKIKYIDKRGICKFELPSSYIKASCFYYGYSLITSKLGGTEYISIIDTTFKIHTITDYVVLDVVGKNEFLAKSHEQDLYFIIDVDQRIKIQLESDFHQMLNNKKGYIVKEGNSYGIRDMSGNYIVRKKYDDISVFLGEDNYLRVKQNGSCGIIDINGVEIVKCHYQDITSFYNGRFVAKKGDGYGIMDINENRLLKFEYDNLFFLKNTDNLIGMKANDNLVSLMDQNGHTIAEYFEAIPFDVSHNYVESDFFDSDVFLDSVLYPLKELTTNILKGSKEIVAEFYPKLDYNDINLCDIVYDKDYEWLPFVASLNIEYGKAKYKFGFEKVVESDVRCISYDSYNGDCLRHQTYYYCSDDNKCKAIIYNIFISDVVTHFDKIENQLMSYMIKKNWNFVSHEGHDYVFSNDNYNLLVEFRNDIHILSFLISHKL